ncbi:MAG TPA: hypothetical protein VF062_24950 [Candidatus Limnocylindrales bacterium]
MSLLRVRSFEEVEVLPSRSHGVDDEFVAAVETKHDDLEEPAGLVYAEA